MVKRDQQSGLDRNTKSRKLPKYLSTSEMLPIQTMSMTLVFRCKQHKKTYKG